MNLLKVANTCLLVLLLSNAADAQGIIEALGRFNKAYPYEKVYVHFDNNKFAPYQTIHYKAYLLAGFQPSLISKNFYVDWYNDKGGLMGSTVTPVSYGYSVGSFTLPANYTGLFVHAVCYTKWMRNFDSLYFYRQTFPIAAAAFESEQKNLQPGETTVKFLPESGTLLSNKVNVIAFKALNNLGLPEEITGIIKNSDGDSVATFRSIHDGMGRFDFIPVAGEKYTAEWKGRNGSTRQAALPASDNASVNLMVEPGRTSRLFRIQRSPDAPERMNQLTFVGQMNGTVLFTANIDLSDRGSITSSLPIDKLPSGILQLTVFDADLTPLCERLVFVKNNDFLFLATIKADTINTAKRAKNVIEVEMNDTTYANLSLSVTDATTGNTGANTIVSQLLLQGDLTGNIYKPAYYFATNADSVNSNLDLVMLTNGWRRYNWNQILKDTFGILPYARDSVYEAVQGKITDFKTIKSKKPASITLFFMTKDSAASTLTLPILEDGSFAGDNVILFDTVKVYYKVNGVAGVPKDNVAIENNLFRGSIRQIQPVLQYQQDTTGFARFRHLTTLQRQADSLSATATLREVTVHVTEKPSVKLLDAKYTSGIFSNEAATAFDMSTMENASHTQSIFDFLTGRVPELVIGNSLGGIATEGVVSFRRGTVTFYLNESPIATSAVNDIDVNNVSYIKVFNPPFVGGLNQSGGQIASGGAIAIYTKKGADLNADAKSFKPNAAMDYKILGGYTRAKEFYSPDYAEVAQMASPVDERNTLLWNPWISLGKNNNKVKLSFYNNDVTHAFLVVLQGMDSRGRLVYVSQLLK